MTTFATDAPSFDDIAVGDALPLFERTPSKVQLVMYAGAEGDYMPVHFDHQYAVAAGQPGVINHGWLTYAILLQAVTSWCPPQVATIVETNCRYLTPSFPGEAVRCSAVVTGKSSPGTGRRVELEITGRNPAGVATTTASVALEFA